MPDARHKSVSDLRNKEKLGVLIATDDEPVEGMVRRVAADDEFLRTVNLVFDPCSCAFARLVERTELLGYDAFETQLFAGA